MRTHVLFPLAAGWLTVATVPSPVRAQQAPDPARVVAAQQRFDRGYELFERDDCATALTEFRASIELVPSPNTRLYIGLCLLRMGTLAEAHAELQRTFTEARDRALADPRYANARNIAERELNALRPRLGRLVLRAEGAPVGASYRVETTEVLPAMLGLPLYFDPGEVTVTAEAPGYVPFRRTVRLLPDTTTELAIPFERAEANGAPPSAPVTGSRGADVVRIEPPRPLPVERITGGGGRIAGYVVGATGLLGVGAFALFGTLARNTYDEVSRLCGGRRCATPAQESRIDEGEAWQLAANVSLGVGIGCLLTGAVLIAVGGPRVTLEEQEERRTATFSPYVDPTHGTAGVYGAF